ncbi:protein translocase subunit SecF [Alkanindiges sp. WGS2144]|uniref:protein translocase subunit SecF n=1 Tax=Alkanindiges sp. WGS2144 TaxID=3366808 RepID=UPI00375264DC
MTKSTAQHPAPATPPGSEHEPRQYGRRGNEPVIRFMRLKVAASILSLLASIICVVVLAYKGLNLGLDFTGGVSAEVNYSQPVEQGQVTNALKQAGFTDPVVQFLGTQRDLIIRMPAQEGEDLAARISQAVQLPGNTASVQKVDAVGSQVGNELYIRSFGAVALALVLMLIYVTIRFEFKLAMGAVIALLHDTIVTVGIFSIFGWPFDLTVLAAVLALIGYSLNDSIVVSDRIRENFRKIRGADPEEVVDISLTETLRRTVMTVATLLLVVLAMLFLGGDGLFWFSVAMLVGLFVGTYSSIYIGTAYALWRGLNRQDFIVQVKPEFEEESMP